jgi:hypothetical protein
MSSEKLEAARRSGDLTAAIGAMREEAATNAGANAGTPVRGEVDVFDAAVHVSAGMAGKSKAERRQVLRNVQAGMTLTGAAHGRVTGKEQVAARRLTRQEKLAKTEAWAKSLSEDQRTEILTSEKFNVLPDRVQEIVAEVFGNLEDRAYEDSIGIENIDLDAQLPDVDAIVGDEDDDETDESYVDPVDEANLNGKTYYYTEENQ